jgi:hypothetical protein
MKEVGPLSPFTKDPLSKVGALRYRYLEGVGPTSMFVDDSTRSADGQTYFGVVFIGNWLRSAPPNISRWLQTRRTDDPNRSGQKRDWTASTSTKSDSSQQSAESRTKNQQNQQKAKQQKPKISIHHIYHLSSTYSLSFPFEDRLRLDHTQITPRLHPVPRWTIHQSLLPFLGDVP